MQKHAGGVLIICTKEEKKCALQINDMVSYNKYKLRINCDFNCLTAVRKGDIIIFSGQSYHRKKYVVNYITSYVAISLLDVSY